MTGDDLFEPLDRFRIGGLDVDGSASALASMVATAQGKRTCPLVSENSTSNLWPQCLQSCWRYFEPLAVFARPLTMAIVKPSRGPYGQGQVKGLGA
jgi:hypothetical protein